jgi:microcin C transport system substrate-binding protein
MAKAMAAQARAQDGAIGQALVAVTVLALALWVGLVAPARSEETIVSHGISTFGDLKYPADLEHID